MSDHRRPLNLPTSIDKMKHDLVGLFAMQVRNRSHFVLTILNFDVVLYSPEGDDCLSFRCSLVWILANVPVSQ